MSVAQETIAAVHIGYKVACISMVTNKVILEVDSDELVDHNLVLQESARRVDDFSALIQKSVEKI